MESFSNPGGEARLRETAGLPAKTYQILVVDDDSAMRGLLVDELREEGYQVMDAVNGKEALSRLETFTPDLIITDLKMPFGGFDFLRQLKIAVPKCPVVLFTAFGGSQTKVKARELGVSVYLEKPMRLSDLKAAIGQLCGM